MILKIYFDLPKEGVAIPINNQKELNSFIHKTLGHDNKYHDAFSNYSISWLMGGKMIDKGSISFSTNPYLFVTSLDSEFIGTLLKGLMDKKYDLFGMKYSHCEMNEFAVNSRFDTILTNSPVIVKDENGRKISVDNLEFIEYLKQNCIRKLKFCGIVDDTFDIILRHPEKAKTKKVMVGESFNICTLISCYVYGKPETRKMLYNLGLGGSTGCGFGSVKVLY